MSATPEQIQAACRKVLGQYSDQELRMRTILAHEHWKTTFDYALATPVARATREFIVGLAMAKHEESASLQG